MQFSDSLVCECWPLMVTWMRTRFSLCKNIFSRAIVASSFESCVRARDRQSELRDDVATKRTTTAESLRFHAPQGSSARCNFVSRVAALLEQSSSDSESHLLTTTTHINVSRSLPQRSSGRMLTTAARYYSPVSQRTACWRWKSSQV